MFQADLKFYICLYCNCSSTVMNSYLQKIIETEVGGYSVYFITGMGYFVQNNNTIKQIQVR